MKTARLLALAVALSAAAVQAQDTLVQAGGVTISVNQGSGDLSKAVGLLLFFAVLSIVPSLVMMMTSFTRLVVVLAFFRQALGVQQVISPRIMAGLALFLTFFIMQPTWNRIYTDAVVPYREKTIDQTVAWHRGQEQLKAFMLANTRESSLLLFMELGEVAPVEDIALLPLRVVVPAFMISELQTAFQMAFLLYLPFLVIDMLIATILMAMGMMMVPPVMVSLPLKLLLFIMVGGWELLVRVLVTSFS